ncbi:MAG: hypothetical protein RLO17_03965, partial [Cyclobacteriaceae bacterium]
LHAPLNPLKGGCPLSRLKYGKNAVGPFREKGCAAGSSLCSPRLVSPPDGSRETCIQVGGTPTWVREILPPMPAPYQSHDHAHR